MIDHEEHIFKRVYTQVTAKYPDIFMTGEQVRVPPHFPCVSVVEIDNTVYDRASLLSKVETAATVTYEVNIYSNKTTGKKSECKRIAELIDNAFETMGFQRIMLNTVQNLEDATIYRIVGRYRKLVTKQEVY